MGHVGHLKTEYQDLLHRLEASQVGMPEPSDPRAWQGWKDILEIIYTPEEAALAARLPVKPASLHKIAGRVGLPPDVLRTKLDHLADKGLVMDIVSPVTGKTRYMLAPPVIGFFEFTFMRATDMFPQKKLAEAMDAYIHGDPVFAAEVFGGDTVVGRAMVREEHVAEDELPEVLDWERATRVVSEARHIGVSYCYCRHKAEHLGTKCDTPLETCLSLNAGADFVVRRGFGREIDTVEALDILTQSKERKLVQIADNVQQTPSYICNCCPCCCGQLRSITDYDLRGVTPSGFQPKFDHDSCNGCSRCARACPVGAITMMGVRVASSPKNDLRPEVDVERCIGCGVCATDCRKLSIEMTRREHQPDVPLNSVDRVIRMSMERGRLPHLIFDEGQSRGAKFLNKALKAIQRLPGAQRAIASKQLKSRFVRFALAAVPDAAGG